MQPLRVKEFCTTTVDVVVEVVGGAADGGGDVEDLELAASVERDVAVGSDCGGC